MRRYTPRFQTTGRITAFYTMDGGSFSLRFTFSHLSSATSYDRAQQDAIRAVKKWAANEPDTAYTGFRFESGLTTVATDGYSTNEPRLKMEG